jgi:hypothetical protein
LIAPLLGHERDGWEYRAWDALTNGYFSILNRVLFNDFWTELISAQDALLALGAAYFDPQAIRSSIFQNQQVAVFLNLGTSQGGHVAPAGTGIPNIDLAKSILRSASESSSAIAPAPQMGSLRVGWAPGRL